MADVVNRTELDWFTYDWGTKTITDQVFNRNPFLMGLREREETYPGGSHIRELLITEEDEGDKTGRAIEGRGAYEVNELPGHQGALYRPKYYVQVIPLWDVDVADNGTSEVQYWNYVAARQSLYAKFMRARFARHLYSRSNDSLQINGLPDIINNTGSLAGIDRAANDWWRSFIFTAGSPRTFTTRFLGNAISATSDGDIMPDVMFTTTDMYDTVEAVLVNRGERYPQNMRLADAGFSNISYRGVPIMIDKYCDVDAADEQHLWVINFDHIRWRPHAAFNMLQSEWMRMPKHMGQYMVVTWFGNVTTNAPRRLAKVGSFNPANTT